MTTPPSLISSVSGYVALLGQRLAGRQALARWACLEPSLARFAHTGELACACREAGPEEQDRLLVAMLAVARDDQLAQLVVVAGLSRRLASAVAAWKRGGASRTDLVNLEADLVSGCWAAVVAVAAALAGGEVQPARLGLALLDQARRSVRAPRRRELRAAARQVSLERSAEPAAEDCQPVAEELAAEIGDAVRAGRISACAARPLFLTRVAGYSPAEAARRLGCTPAVVRAVRSRAERALVA